MFGISSLEELPELPKYKMDENEQIVIDDIIEKDTETNEQEEDKNTTEEEKEEFQNEKNTNE